MIDLWIVKYRNIVAAMKKKMSDFEVSVSPARFNTIGCSENKVLSTQR